MFIVLLIVGCIAIFWIGVAILPESRDEKAKRMQENLKELRNNRTAPILKFRSHEEGMQFLQTVVEEGDLRLLPSVYKEQAEKYMKARPLTITQARAELKVEREKIYANQYHSYTYSPARAVREWEEWEEREELAITDPARYERLVEFGVHERWSHKPKDEDLIYCVLDIVVQDEFPDTEQLYKYISNLTDDGIEKLMNIIGNKLERLHG